MAIASPAKIAILGGGPIGLEAALYARFLGYQVEIYEQGSIAENVMRWGHVEMFSPFRMNTSPLGLAALAAHDPDFEPPNDDAILTGKNWLEQYLLPLSQTDLLSGCIHESTTVLSLARSALLKNELLNDPKRSDAPLNVLLTDPLGNERIEQAEIVIDTTGTFENHRWLGTGGNPAIGETQSQNRIEYRLPDLLGKSREQYAGKHILVIGSGYSAATNIVALARLAQNEPRTQITWITRNKTGEERGPIPEIPKDRLPQREQLCMKANHLANDPKSCVTHWCGTVVDKIIYNESSDAFSLSLCGKHKGEFSFDRVIANVGYQPNREIYRELQVHECYATEGPIKLAAALLENSSIDCLEQKGKGPSSLMNPEPNFYILGSKSYGRNSNFLISAGLKQIQELFTVIGDRKNLDLYANAMKLLP